MHRYIKQAAKNIGFDACKIAQADYLSEDAAFFQRWLAEGKQGEMHYLERNAEKRYNPQVLVPGCKSVVVVLMNYFTQIEFPTNSPKLALYACPAVDYHTVIKQKLSELETAVIEKYGKQIVNPDCQHIFVDSAPVLERRWAERAGLGWIGRNKQLIASELGSYCFVGILLLNAETTYDTPVRNACGRCRKCIDACPTKAFSDSGFDARRCISYQNIEKKGTIDSDMQTLLNSYIAGCDICAKVCPWNKKWAKTHNHPELAANSELADWNVKSWENLTEKQYNNIFAKSALSRLGFSKLKENIQLVVDSKLKQIKT
ncbi:MAG: tRNA epoxyqueuosine(34) reductase QueG [Paludibacter sp.]|jgi:epoxyqueuosine reductase|nr:tRNA epoxyqueuosine(34) reductase QueG [Paludibacter sp.]